MSGDVAITGFDLGPDTVAAIARRRAPVRIDPAARERIEAAARAVRSAAHAGRAIYGVTTGLGSRVVERVDPGDPGTFSLQTLRGRAMSVGEPLATELTRAAMVVRLNGLCAGGAGAGVAVADGLAALLNAGVHPRIPGSGSIGASDLCLLAPVGLAIVGEGEVELGGEWMPAARALARAGLRAVALGPKDGLAICSSSAVSVGAAALALHDARACLEAAQVAAALSMEGFRANLSPLDPRVVAARPAPGQAWSAGGLRALLAGGSLTARGAARRVQDPLSLRCVSQVHGSMRCALDLLAAALEPELHGAADNPLVLAADDEILSNGNFHVPVLALALDATAIAVSQVASLIAERHARLTTERLSGLPANLSSFGATASGLAPLTKTAHALSIEIRHRAAPLSIHPTVGADGVEDDSTSAAQAALRIGEQLQRLWLLVAVELVAAAQAVDLAAPPRLGAGTAAAHACVRAIVAPLVDDRPLGVDVERLATAALVGGELLSRVREAIA
ncbi:MAG: aromatic amino acid lyase [Solirubrobacteraceae bacterium]